MHKLIFFYNVGNGSISCYHYIAKLELASLLSAVILLRRSVPNATKVNRVRKYKVRRLFYKVCSRNNSSLPAAWRSPVYLIRSRACLLISCQRCLFLQQLILTYSIRFSAETRLFK